MRCARCAHVNRDTAKFCEECGQALAGRGPEPNERVERTSPVPPARDASPRRRSSAPPASTLPPSGAADPRGYTPRHLAERILGARAALVGERKQVTVLFADIQGSMDLADKLGAEAWHRALDRFFHLVNEAVHRFDGTVNQYTGDGVMALFGAPLALEDHAQRACHAAHHLLGSLPPLAEDLRKKHGVALAVRMGLNSGEVVVGAIGDDLRMDYTAQGHSVGTAQRIEQLAAPNSAYLAPSTAALCAAEFELRDLGEQALKGVREPMRVHELIGPRPERSRIELVLTRSSVPLAGRRVELAELERALDEAVAGRGQVVGVVGEPGVGKTRLCLELCQQCGQRDVVLAQAHCPTHAQSVPLLPVLELLRSLCDVHGDDAQAMVRRKVRRRLLALQPGFAETLPFVFDTLGVPDPATPVHATEAERGAALAGLLRRVVQAQSAAAPLLIFVDDVQCMDGAADRLLGEMIDALNWTRTLMLVNFRPGHRAPWMGVPHYREVTVAPLDDGGVEELLDAVLGTDEEMRDVRRLIREHTGGNPFFVEEVVRALVDDGTLERAPAARKRDSTRRLRLVRAVAELSIPATVQALLAARLDRLPARDKLVLQAAAVVGRTFAPPVLRHLLGQAERGDAGLDEAEVDASLSALHALEFLRRDGDDRDAELAFRHPLTQAVAYGSQLAEARAALHVGITEALQALYADRLGTHAALLAHHFQAADRKYDAMRWRRRAALHVTNIELGRSRR
jgi:class 3 adenylate cyclase